EVLICVSKAAMASNGRGVNFLIRTAAEMFWWLFLTRRVWNSICSVLEMLANTLLKDLLFE
ncbi:MAG: hypothetical protein ACO38R_07790, partial [Ilumatobacteraceae bacterium]